MTEAWRQEGSSSSSRGAHRAAVSSRLPETDEELGVGAMSAGGRADAGLGGGGSEAGQG